MAADLGEQAVMVMYKTGSEMTLTMLKAIIQRLLEKNTELQHGEQSMKALNLQGKKLEHVELSGQDIKEFRKALRKYAVDFSVMQDKTAGTYSVFFKGQDTDRIYAGLKGVLKEAVAETGEKKHIKDVIEQAAKKSQELAAQHKTPPEKSRNAEIGERG